MKIVKFGGSSLADGEQFQKVINIVTADPKRQVIVSSAPGKRFDGDQKVTDLLIQYAQLTIAHEDVRVIQQAIIDRYQAIADHFDLPTAIFTPIQTTILTLGNHNYPNDEYLLAAFKAHGERLNAQLLALILNHLNVAADYLDPEVAGITVTDNPNNASVLPVTYQQLEKLKLPSKKLIVPGFFGFTTAGNIATFSRGGSDITGAILAKGLHAELYENFTDVDAIYAANPTVVQQPLAINQMTYREMRELSYAGFSVFHDEAIIPAIEGHIAINVKNTNHPDLPGTLIVPEENFVPDKIVTGVASAKHFAALYLHRYLLNKEVGFTLQLLQIFAQYDVSYEHMPSGIDDLTIIFDKRQLDDTTIHAMCHDIQTTLQPDALEWIDDYAIIMVVGEGMKDRVGVIETIVAPLAEAHIGVHMINQGASRIAIMLGTHQADADEAVRKIYHHFFVPNNALNPVH